MVNGGCGRVPVRSCRLLAPFAAYSPNSRGATCGSAPQPLPIGRGMTHNRRRAGEHPPVPAVKAVDSPPRGSSLTSVVLASPRSRDPPQPDPSSADVVPQSIVGGGAVPTVFVIVPSHPPYLEADCCILVIAASQCCCTRRRYRCLHHRCTRVGGG